MNLKRLEISGFKSFAEKTVLDFNKQITAVVGPNGSGKSNIADALRWVLGEQGLKSLRIKASEDLIFAGSNKKTRLGAAQVFLYLDNEAENAEGYPEEITLGRKLFRSGENEYLINKKQVRLKDVTQIAAQLGIGPKSYAVITQGMADAILNATPKERRSIFEEAAGVKLFQMKKDETLRKLESTKNNLLRVEDLLREILPHLKFLERQAKKAEKRQSVEEELREKQSRFYGFKLAYLEEEFKSLESDKNASKSKITALIGELEASKEELEKENQTTGQKEQEEIDLESKMNELYSRQTSLTRDIALIEGKIEVMKQFKNVQAIKERVQDYSPIQEEIGLDLIKKQIGEIYDLYQELINNISNISSAEELNSLKNNFFVLGKKLELVHKELNISKPISVPEKDQPVVGPAGDSKEVIQLRGERDGLQQNLGAIVQEIEGSRNRLREIKETEREARKKFFDFERQVRLGEDQILLAESRTKDLESQGERVAIRKEELLREIQEYQIEIKKGEPVGAVNEREMESDIFKLRRQLEEIGSIDEAILNEFKETDERYNFLLKEKTDLERASSDLREAVVVLNNQVNRQFNDKFKEINEEFNKYFKIIFGGGKAMLKKVEAAVRAAPETEEENTSSDSEEQKPDQESGIDIKVSLPNKKIESINVMSGGERALTSLAILFSIIGANPPPFCVLDEVDAALDDANANRFSKILEDLSHRTQFILITHNRETMHAAKVLYGITMEQEGISKLVSVKIES